MAKQFTDLEVAAFDDICRRFPVEAHVLKAQLATAHDIARENTGAGFFTRFRTEDTGSRLEGPRLRDGGWAQIVGFKQPVGFILWLDQGQANCLECFAIDDTTTDINLETISFEILPDRN